MYFETQLLGWPNTWMESHVAWFSQQAGSADHHQDESEIGARADFDPTVVGAAQAGRV